MKLHIQIITIFVLQLIGGNHDTLISLIVLMKLRKSLSQEQKMIQ